MQCILSSPCWYNIIANSRICHKEDRVLHNILKLYSCFQLIVSYEPVLSSKLIVVSRSSPLKFCSYIPENYSWQEKSLEVEIGD